ncbi:MAG: hypothetical protein EOM92_10085 [Gammaproteobacteria bacterium]|jgi:hypothetical protein|nr:hypothetical protein [Gammaproteobacteria bacterium]
MREDEAGQPESLQSPLGLLVLALVYHTHFAAEDQPLALGGMTEIGLRCPRQSDEVEGGLVQAHAPGLDLGPVEDGVDEAEQMIATESDSWSTTVRKWRAFEHARQ